MPALGKLHDELSGLPTNASEVLLEVFCSSVNPTDLYTDGYLKPKPLGSDVVGRVVAVANSSSHLKVGDVVWGDIGANAALGSDPSKTTKELGAYAEFAVALDSQLSLAPLGAVPLLEACSLPKVALTVYKALVWYAGAPWAPPGADSPGAPQRPNVLVLGGSGGTGSAALQLASFFGASTVATTASPANFDYCASLGATTLIDYHTVDWADGATFPPGFLDVVLDTVGEAGTAAKALSLLSPHGGRFVTIAGALAPGPGAAPPGTSQFQFINSDTNLASAPELEALAAVASAGGLRMPSVAVYGLDQVAEAFATSAAGHVVGKLVVSVKNDTAADSGGARPLGWGP